MKAVGEANLPTGGNLPLQGQELGETITEIAVVEMGIQVVYHGPMVDGDVVGVHIIAAGDIMRGRIHHTMELRNGIQVTKKGKMVGVISQVLKFKTLQVGKLSLVVRVAVPEPKVAVAVAVVGNDKGDLDC